MNYKVFVSGKMRRPKTAEEKHRKRVALYIKAARKAAELQKQIRFVADEDSGEPMRFPVKG